MYSAQSTYALALAQLAGQLGQQQYQWAQGAFGNLQGETAGNVSLFLNAANQGLDLAGNQMQQYENTYVPLQNQLVADAGSYNSSARQNYNMGAAGSAAAQAGNAALDAAKQNLTSYGIDPSSGMYGELEDSQKVANAASVAGAEQQAMINTQAVGRQLRGEAISVGQQMPAATVNALNATNNSVTGSENAALGTANAGATLMDSANPFLATAMNLKYPPVGNNTVSTGTSNSSSSPSPGSNSHGSSSGGGFSGGSGGGSGGGGPYIGDSGPIYSSNDTNPSFSDPYYSDYATASAAEGGAIPGPTTGGHVPRSASPSMGRQTDDIPARLNADEFVIPRDVVKAKGTEFFQKLIAQARKNNAMGPAHPSAGPPLGNTPPRFVSRPMHGAI